MHQVNCQGLTFIGSFSDQRGSAALIEGVTQSSFCYVLMLEASGVIFSLALYSSN